MDVLAKIDRTLLDNELRNMVRFPVFRESDKALFNVTYKIRIDNGYPCFTLGAAFHAIPYDDTNRKFQMMIEKLKPILSISEVVEILSSLRMSSTTIVSRLLYEIRHPLRNTKQHF